MTAGKKASRFGSRGLGGIVSLLISVFGFGYLTYRSTLKDTGSTEAAWRDVGSIGLIAFIGLLVLMVVLAAIRSVSSRRDRKLRSRFPTALVLSSVTIPQLRQALNKSAADKDGLQLPRFGYISLMASPNGVSVWNGWREPTEIRHWKWRDVLELQASTFEELGRSSNGVEITIRHGDGALELPFVVVGAGFGGIMPAKLKRISQWVTEILQFREESSSSDDGRLSAGPARHSGAIDCATHHSERGNPSFRKRSR